MFDDGSEFGVRVARRLREEMIVWLTTVTPCGAPRPREWGSCGTAAATFRSTASPARESAPSRANAKLSLNFDGDGSERGHRRSVGHS
jgi:hypothetical protein